MSNKLTSFVKKHSTAIIVSAYAGVIATFTVITVLAIIKARTGVTYTIDDFASPEIYEDFKAAMALSKEYDAVLTFKADPQL